MARCSEIRAIDLPVSLPNPLTSLIEQVVSLDRIPLYDWMGEAGVKLLEVRKELFNFPRVPAFNQLMELARLFAFQVKIVKPSLIPELNKCVPFEVAVNFTVSTVHHLFMFAYLNINLHNASFQNL